MTAMSRKAGTGRGTIWKDADRGKWIAQAPPHHGRRKRSFATKHAAQDWLATLDGPSAAGKAPAALTVADWLDAWNADRDVRESTRREAAARLRLHVIPTVGRLRLDQITPQSVQSILADLRDRSSSYRRLVWQDLSTAMRAAIKAGLIRENPCEGSRPRPQSRELDAWTEDEARRFVAGIPPENRYRPLWLLLLGTGMRIGEALALTPGAVDPDQGTVRIDYTLDRATRTASPPKTQRSRRTVSVPDFALGPLRPLLEDGRIWLFEAPEGGPVHYWNLTRRFWQRTTRAAGVRYIPIHGLRHTYVTLALRAGATVSEVGAAIGDSEKTVLAVYSHVLPGAGRESAARINAVFAGVQAPLRRAL